jgi:hydrogenase-1 operon protein HyaE
MSLSQLIARLNTQGLPALDRDAMRTFVQTHEYTLLCFFNDPKAFPENFDVAVVVPELLKSFPAIHAAVAEPQALAALALIYDVNIFPSLILLHNGEVRQRWPRIQAWGVYQQQLQALLES